MAAGVNTKLGDRLGRTPTQREDEVFEYLVDYIDEHGWAPSHRQIREEVRLGHLVQVAEALAGLKGRGLIDYQAGQARAICILDRTPN